MHCRAAGQWFQSESVLHQNWMRDYDPYTSRFIQADPVTGVGRGRWRHWWGVHLAGQVLQCASRNCDIFHAFRRSATADGLARVLLARGFVDGR